MRSATLLIDMPSVGKIKDGRKVIRKLDEQDRKQEALEPGDAPLEGELRANSTRLIIMQSHNAHIASNMFKHIPCRPVYN